MRETESTEQSKGLLIEAFKNSYVSRRSWIVKEKPLVSEILERFPRFRDLLEGVSFIIE